MPPRLSDSDIGGTDNKTVTSPRSLNKNNIEVTKNEIIKIIPADRCLGISVGHSGRFSGWKYHHLQFFRMRGKVEPLVLEQLCADPLSHRAGPWYGGVLANWSAGLLVPDSPGPGPSRCGGVHNPGGLFWEV